MSTCNVQKCTPCRDWVRPLKGRALEEATRRLGPRWHVVDEHHLRKDFTFADFRQALDFVNRVGALAEEQGHHPNIHLAYGKVAITLWTHKIDGLHENDFILAGLIDAL